MSTLPPNHHHHRETLMRTSSQTHVNMAVAQPTTMKTKSASKAKANNAATTTASSETAASKQKAQMHRRSRTGLCRLFPSGPSSVLSRLVSLRS